MGCREWDADVVMALQSLDPGDRRAYGYAEGHLRCTLDLLNDVEH